MAHTWWSHHLYCPDCYGGAGGCTDNLFPTLHSPSSWFIFVWPALLHLLNCQLFRLEQLPNPLIHMEQGGTTESFFFFLFFIFILNCAVNCAYPVFFFFASVSCCYSSCFILRNRMKFEVWYKKWEESPVLLLCYYVWTRHTWLAVYVFAAVGWRDELCKCMSNVWWFLPCLHPHILLDSSLPLDRNITSQSRMTMTTESNYYFQLLPCRSVSWLEYAMMATAPLNERQHNFVHTLELAEIFGPPQWAHSSITLRLFVPAYQCWVVFSFCIY